MRSVVFYMRFFVWFSLRNMRKHPGRALTVLFGIALGAAVFTSVRLSIHASMDSFTNSMDLIAGRADRVIIQPGGHVPEELVSALLNHPAVETASPILTTYCKPAQEHAEPFLLIGFDPILDRPLRDWQIADTRNQEAEAWLDLLKEPYTLIIGESLALKYECRRGDLLTIEHARQTATFKVAGILQPEGLALVDEGLVAITDIATFQELTGLYGLVDRIDILFKAGVIPDEVNLEHLLPQSIVLCSPSAAKESGQGMIRAYQLNLSILSFASLFVGMFLVYSLVALNAASRRHELAVLRSTGASSNLLFIKGGTPPSHHSLSISGPRPRSSTIVATSV
jgi:putative ABC transport system permease protein